MIKGIDKKKFKLNSLDSQLTTTPFFCLKYITSNNKFNFSHFKKDKKKLYEAKALLLDKLIEYRGKEMIELFSLPKESGLETIGYNQLNNINPKGISLSKDTKVTVFRYNKGEYRILAIPSSVPVSDGKMTIYHIFAFDFDHSAYNHG